LSKYLDKHTQADRVSILGVSVLDPMQVPFGSDDGYHIIVNVSSWTNDWSEWNDKMSKSGGY